MKGSGADVEGLAPEEFGGASRARDVFPLPPRACLPDEIFAGLSRGVKQRVQKRAVRDLQVDEVAAALNDIYGLGRGADDPAVTERGARPVENAAQAKALGHLSEVLTTSAAASNETPPHEAPRELLGMSLAYNGAEDVTHVRAYDRDLLSLPNVGHHAPMAADLLDPPSAEVVREFQQRMMLSPDAWEQRLQGEPAVKPCMDERLRTYRSLYARFAADLISANVASLTQSPADLVTPFFVETRGKPTIRLVVDCRAPNPRFLVCPPFEMATGSSWGRPGSV